MKVTILSQNMGIGHADLIHLDPHMGVAFGPFTPTENYSRFAHANMIDGESAGDKDKGLRIHSDIAGAIEGAELWIDDYPILDEIQLTLNFKDAQQYDALFKDHPAFR